jgi:phosphatidylinositol glycan class B
MSVNEEKKLVQSLHLPAGLVIPYLCILRILNALTINTFFQADEYWQSLEPAHKFVFGYGSLTWEWEQGLRGFLHPFLFSLIYKISDIFDLGELGVLYLPKILQAVIAGIGEYYFYTFVYKVTKNEIIARWSLFLSVVSVFNWYVITRTFSNSLELTLTCIALSYWPWSGLDLIQLDKSLIFAAISCFIRPTNGLIWLILGFQLLLKSGWIMKARIILHTTMVTALVFSINVSIDYFYYGKITIPIWNFIEFNVLSSLSKFYGVAPWHFHIAQSLPLILLTFLPFFIIGFLRYDNKIFKFITISTIIAFSSVDHKEFRFLYPIQPILLLITAYGFHHLNLHHPKLIKISTYIIIIINTAISIFLTQFHERGVIDVIHYLRDDIDVYSVGFLTPCHSTPWQSYLHREDLEANSWFLTCEPPLHLLNDSSASEKVDHYMDESDYFYDDPKTFLYKNFPPPLTKDLVTSDWEYKYYWPSHLVFFGDLEPFITDYLKDSSYRECNRFFNSYFHWDDRRRGDVIVYCKWPWE